MERRLIVLSDIALDLLKDMYDQCLKKFDKKEKSLWLLVVMSNSNTIKRAVKESSYNSPSPSAIMDELIKSNYVCESEPGVYSITAEGILYVEKNIYHLDDGALVDWVNKKMMFNNRKITDKNRIVLLTLLAARCFSDSACATYVEKDGEAAFLDLIRDSNTFLIDHEIIEKDAIKVSSKQKSKSEISAILDQIDKLPSSSGMLFVARDKKYYLDVFEDGMIKVQSITMLTKIILGEKTSYEAISDLKVFCKKSYMKYGYIFRTGDVFFEGAMVDYDIDSGMDDALI